MSRFAFCLLMAAACTADPEKDVLTESARQFFAAATRSDTVTLAALSTDQEMVQLALTGARTEPNLFRLAAETITLDRAWVRGDTANTFFRLPRSERLAIRFLRRDTVWLVNHVGFPDR